MPCDYLCNCILCICFTVYYHCCKNEIYISIDLSLSLALNGCHRIDGVFDQYFSLSFKAGERQTRGASIVLEVQIRGTATPVPKQWLKYIANVQNEVNLCHSWKTLGAILV